MIYGGVDARVSCDAAPRQFISRIVLNLRADLRRGKGRRPWQQQRDGRQCFLWHGCCFRGCWRQRYGRLAEAAGRRRALESQSRQMGGRRDRSGEIVRKGRVIAGQFAR